jgi:hypothetical protein
VGKWNVTTLKRLNGKTFECLKVENG